MAVKVLDESLGKVVLIKLKGGKVIRGNLHGFDQHMNLLLEDSVEILEEGKSYSLGSVSFTTPVRHLHPVETYGMLFRAGGYTFAYIADTLYFEGLARIYASQLLIINVVFLEPRPPVEHLSVPDAKRIITELKPKVAILTHFGMTMWRAKPWEIAQGLSQDTGIRVVAARDGMRFDLSQLD